MVNGDKKKALLALKKKKYQQNLLEQTEGQLFNLEQLTMTIENASMEAEVIKGLELGNQVLKEINKEMDLDKVEKLMADTADAIAYQNVKTKKGVFEWRVCPQDNNRRREGGSCQQTHLAMPFYLVLGNRRNAQSKAYQRR